jgi:hypothetical protein
VEAAEGERAEAEAEDGRARLDPARREGRVGEPEAEVDGVSWRVVIGLVGCWGFGRVLLLRVRYIPVCMDTKEPQTEMEALSSRPVMR